MPLVDSFCEECRRFLGKRCSSRAFASYSRKRRFPFISSGHFGQLVLRRFLGILPGILKEGSFSKGEDAGKTAKRGGKQVSALNSRIESARCKMLRFYVLIQRSAAFCLKRVVFPRRKKKYIPKSDSAKYFSKVLIFYGHFHDIMKYSGNLFHVFVS